MLGSIKLSLLLGPVPVPAPNFVVEAITSVKVEAGAGETQSGFEIAFDVPLRSPLRAMFLATGGGAVGGVPFMRVVLVVTMNGRSEPIVDGVATDIEVQPADSGVSKLVVKGKDLSALMDVQEFPAIPYPAMPPSVRVLAILAKYAVFGVIPMVIPSVVDEPPMPLERIPQHKGTDYQYVKQLAHEAGYVFYVEPGPAPGMSRAYWGPEIRVGMPQPALTMGMDAISNVDQLSFHFDREAKSIPIVYFHETATRMPIGIPIPDVTPMNPPLGLVPPLPPKVEHLSDTGHLSPGLALMRGLAYAAQHSDAVFGSGSIDVVRYGRVLKSRALVGVRGVGLPYDGLYFVRSVSHDIQRGAYKQTFSLARNGLFPTVPTVPT
ncbi:MAG TPA: hypothetical protein VFU13_20215 [Steroidobacteraceae bacterium]|nr:hypothetical protein [Steroidobacteraceae bacterium]